MRFFELLGEQPLYILWLWLAAINLAAFLAMGIDKFRASRQKWRIPERTLFLLAAIGGSLGGICGIYVFRHKTLLSSNVNSTNRAGDFDLFKHMTDKSKKSGGTQTRPAQNRVVG